MAKQIIKKNYTTETNSAGEIEKVVYDIEKNTRTILETIETPKSKINKTYVFTEEQKAFLLELFK